MSPARRWPVVVAVVALVAGLAAVAYFTPLMSVRAVSVHGLESGSTLTADQVVAAAQVPKGRPLLQVNTAQAAHRVAAIAAVQAGVARLGEVRTARAALARLDADTLRQLLAARRHRAGQDRP